MNRRVSRIAAWMVALALIATPIIAALNGWMAEERWPISRLIVEGRFVHVSDAEVRSVVAPLVQPGFFAVELDLIKTEVERLPWVARAEVRKHWPDRIDVRVIEREPIAHWGADRLLASDGVVFSASMDMLPETLPRLDGPRSRAVEVWDGHRSARERLRSIGIDIASTRMNERGAWTLVARDDAEIVLGREQPMKRLDRFVATLARLPEAERVRIARADLRFANGFAVVWRAPPTSVPTAPMPAAVSPEETATGSANEPQV